MSFRSRTQDFLKTVFRIAGLDVQWSASALTERNVLSHVFGSCPIDLVVDVGANIGQYGKLIRECGYRGRLVSFEPLEDAHARLVERALADPNWTIAPPLAIGAAEGEITINVAANSASSSALPMLSSHLEAAPHSGYIRQQRTLVTTLDAALRDYLSAVDNGLLKIDTQGFEREVLTGAKSSLAKFQYVQLELSLVPLYQNQPLFGDLFRLLDARGYSLAYLIPGFRDPRTRMPLQYDGIFQRRDAA